MFKPLMVYEAGTNFSLMTNFPQPCENQQRHWHLCFLGFSFFWTIYPRVAPAYAALPWVIHM